MSVIDDTVLMLADALAAPANDAPGDDTEDWWDILTKRQKQRYIKEHPNSKYAKQPVEDDKPVSDKKKPASKVYREKRGTPANDDNLIDPEDMTVRSKPAARETVPANDEAFDDKPVYPANDEDFLVDPGNDEPANDVSDEPANDVSDEPANDVSDEPANDVSDEPANDVSDEPVKKKPSRVYREKRGTPANDEDEPVKETPDQKAEKTLDGVIPESIEDKPDPASNLADREKQLTRRAVQQVKRQPAQPSANQPGQNNYGLKQRNTPRIPVKTVKRAMKELPKQQQDFIRNGGIRPKSKQRLKLGEFARKEAKTMATGFFRDVVTAKDGINVARKLWTGKRLEPGDTKKLASSIFSMFGYMAALSLGGPAGALIFGAASHAILPAIGFMFGRRNWFNENRPRDMNIPKGKPQNFKHRKHASVFAFVAASRDSTEYADDTETLTRMFEGLSDFIGEGTIPDEAWAKSIVKTASKTKQKRALRKPHHRNHKPAHESQQRTHKPRHHHANLEQTMNIQQFEKTRILGSFSGINTRTLAITDYKPVTPTLARVVISCTGHFSKDEVRAAISEKLGQRAAVVANSFRIVQANPDGASVSVGFIRANREVRVLKENEIRAGYRVMASNILMNNADRSLWEVRESQTGNKYLARHGANEDLSELLEANTNHIAYTPAIRNIANASARPAELVAYVADSGDVEHGFVTAATNEAVTVVSRITHYPATISQERVIAAVSVNVPREHHARMVQAGISPADKAKAKDYWRELFSYDPSYMSEMCNMVDDDASA